MTKMVTVTVVLIAAIDDIIKPGKKKKVQMVVGTTHALT